MVLWSIGIGKNTYLKKTKKKGGNFLNSRLRNTRKEIKKNRDKFYEEHTRAQKSWKRDSPYVNKMYLHLSKMGIIELERLARQYKVSACGPPTRSDIIDALIESRKVPLPDSSHFATLEQMQKEHMYYNLPEKDEPIQWTDNPAAVSK